MAIKPRYEGRYKYFSLICDRCGSEAGHFDDFNEAVDEKKNYGFRSVNTSGVWEDVCEECQDMEQYKRGTATAAEDFAGLG